MKRSIAIASFAIAAMLPSVAMAAEEAGGSQGSWLMLAFFAINFVAFVILLKILAVPMIRKFFSDRAIGIRSNLSKAQQAFAEAEKLAKEAGARAAGLEQELAKLKRDMETETAYQAARIAEAATAAAERLKRDTRMSADALAGAAQRRVRTALASSAAALAREVISRNFQAGDQGRLIDGFMDKLNQEGRR